VGGPADNGNVTDEVVRSEEIGGKDLKIIRKADGHSLIINHALSLKFSVGNIDTPHHRLQVKAEAYGAEQMTLAIYLKI